MLVTPCEHRARFLVRSRTTGCQLVGKGLVESASVTRRYRVFEIDAVLAKQVAALLVVVRAVVSPA